MLRQPKRKKGDTGKLLSIAKKEGMEESYETFEEELWPPRTDPPPLKPVRQIRRPEMYTTRKIREEMTPQQTKTEPKTLPREPSIPITPIVPKAVSVQNLSQIERPWENVTLNRCLFVAITILVFTSGFQKLHETMRGQGAAEEEEEFELAVRRPGVLRHRGQPPEPETTLWEVMFWWLPDFDDEDDEEEDEDDSGEAKRGKSKREMLPRSSKSLRNRPLPDKNLMKQRGGKLKDKRAKKTRDEETKEKKEKDKIEEPEEETEDEEVEEEEEEIVPKKTTKKEKKKTQKG